MPNLPNQFINWCEIADLPPKKPRKVPCDANRKPIDPHNPAHWLTLEQAQSTGLNIGFVLTDNDPYFLLDLDDIKTPEGTWDDWSQSIFAQFQNAAWEVSWSGNGVHIMGRCDASRLTDRKNKFADSKGEFYHTKRFVAFGQGLQGDIDIDWTETLLRVVPARDAADSAPVNYTGPVLGWNGPTDDTVLINKAMNAAGSAAVQFGDKASFGDLWNCDVAKLAQVFPSPSEDEFDRSSADAALMSHLAFWTGKDYMRMDRLFRQSGLMREKYDTRPDYQQNTITGAIRHCQNVYTGGAQDNHKSGALPHGFMLFHDQREHFKGAVYVTGLNKALTPKGVLLGKDQFDIEYRAEKFQLFANNESGGSTKSAWEAFTRSQADHPKVDLLSFEPDKPFGAVHEDDYGISWVNSFRPHKVERIKGDVAPFLDFMAKLIPDADDRAILLSYMAGLSRYTGQKSTWAPILIGTHGIGKSSVIRIIEYLIDGTTPDRVLADSHCTRVESHALGSQFNCFMQGKIFGFVEELHTSSYKDSMTRLQVVKSLITDPLLTVECKGKNSFQIPNKINWLFCSNHKDAIRIDPSERRFSIFYLGSDEATGRNGLTDQYHKGFWQWLWNDQGFAKVANYLHNEFAIPEHLDFTKGANEAPKTSHHDLAVYQSRSGNEQTLIDVLADNESQGLRGGMASSAAIAEGFFKAGVDKAPHTKTLNGLLERVGYVRLGKATKNIGVTRPVLYCRADLKSQLQQQANSLGGFTELFMAQNGYSEAPTNIIPLTKGKNHE